MNINSIIEKAFADFKVNGKIIPISFLNYTGNADVYLTYYTWLEKPENFYDDENHSEIAYGTIDIFSKNNFKDILESVKESSSNTDLLGQIMALKLMSKIQAIIMFL